MIENLLTQLGTTTAVVAVAGYLLRSWFSYQIQLLRSDYEHQNTIQIETIRAEFSRDLARLNIHENYLHRKRVDLIESMHHRAVDAEYSLQTFFLGWWTITDIDEVKGKALNLPYPTEDALKIMKENGKKFCEYFLEINSSLHKNALFFDDEFIRGVVDAYDPFFKLILNIDYNSLPRLPEEYKDVVVVGRIPRHFVVKLFREALGVMDKA